MRDFEDYADGQQLGVCPVCSSEDIEYDTLEPADDSIYYPATCKTCGCEFKEYYDLAFAGHSH